MFTLSISLLVDLISFLLLSRFLDMISLLSETRELIFEAEYVLGIFDTGLFLCKSLDAAIYSGKPSGSTKLRLLKESSADK